MNDEELLTWRAYFSLAFAVLFFSGIFQSASGNWAWLRAFDFNTLAGRFGCIDAGAGCASDFAGRGSSGASAGVLLSLQLVPAIMLALGVIALVERGGAFEVARRLLTPHLQKILGLPGDSAVVMVSSLQSTDAAAVMTRGMAERGRIDEDQLTVLAMWQFSASGPLINFFTSAPILFPLLAVPVAVPLLVILLFKFVGANSLRLYFFLRRRWR
ncbi:MAG: hypothetical protein RR101_10390 [Burkholderiaceae bacterium]